MRSRRGAYISALPFGPLLQRTAVAAVAALLIFLIFSERNDSGYARMVRSTMTEGLVPVLDVLSAPVDAADHALNQVGDYWSVREENKRLRIENERLLQWQSAALKFESENAALRELLNYHPMQAKTSVTARVIGSAGNSLSHHVLIDAGSAQGIRRHQAVMNDLGLVGRVVSVSQNTAKVLLITDMNSRIPVMTDPSGLRALLAGDRTELPYLTLASARHTPQLGDVIVTASDGDIFPAGLPVGKVFSEEKGKWHVRPLADMDTLRYVRVMAFDMPESLQLH